MRRHLLMRPRPGNAQWLARIVEQATGLVPEVTRMNGGFHVASGSNWAAISGDAVERRDVTAVQTWLRITDWPEKLSKFKEVKN